MFSHEGPKKIKEIKRDFDKKYNILTLSRVERQKKLHSKRKRKISTFKDSELVDSDYEDGSKQS